MLETVLHESTNGHYTNNKVKVEGDVITTESPYEVKHVEHEPLEIDYKSTKKRIVVEKTPFEDHIQYIAD